MICVRCGQHNQPGMKYCEHCNMLLPRLDPESEITVPKESGLYSRLVEMTRRVREQEITPLEFSEQIASTFASLGEKSHEIQEIVYSTNYYHDSPEEVEAGFTGIQMFEEGLAVMARFIDTGDQGLLVKGLELAWKGNELINEAKRLNRGTSGQLTWNVWG